MAFIEFQDVSGAFKAGVADIGTGNVDTAFEGVEKEIVEWCNEQIQLFRNKIDANKSRATGNLQQSLVVAPIKRFGKDYAVEIEAPEYWKLLEYGQKGTQESTKAPNSPFTVKTYPRLEDMVKWVQFKGIRSGKKNVYSFASQVRKSIYKKGTYAHPFVAPTLTTERLDDLTQRVAEFTAQAFTAVLLPK
jgi:Bacteriophage HK97-gp10, putative tail-component